MCRWKDSSEVEPRAHRYTFSSTPPLGDCANLRIELSAWWVKDTVDVLSNLFPFFPDPPAIEERHTQRITTLLTVEKLYKVCNVTYNVLGATGCAAAVKRELATGNSTENISISWLCLMPYALALHLPFLCQFEALEIVTVPLENAL